MANNLIVKKLGEDYHKYLHVDNKESTVDFHGSTLLAEELCRTLAVKFYIWSTGWEPSGIDFNKYPDKTVDEISEILITKEFNEFIKEYYGTEEKN
jgi:hypothetical protein